jgi:hypothetical protein
LDEAFFPGILVFADYDGRRVAVQKQDRVYDLDMLEDVFLGGQIEQDVVRLCMQDVDSWNLAGLSKEIRPRL